MGVRIFSNEDGAVFYCSTSQWAFGPMMPGANVAEAFAKTATTDFRLLSDADLESKWNEFDRTLMTCPVGHHETDVESYGDETIFTCMAKDCKAQWNLAGEPLIGDDQLAEVER